MNGKNKEGTKRAQTGGEGEYQNWRELLERVVHHQKSRRVTHKGKQYGAPNQVHQICSHFQAFAAVRVDQFG